MTFLAGLGFLQSICMLVPMWYPRFLGAGGVAGLVVLVAVVVDSYTINTRWPACLTILHVSNVSPLNCFPCI